MMLELRIGVVGHTIPRFDERKALSFLQEAFDSFVREYPAQYYSVVAGLTDLGMNGIAYREAQRRRRWITKGVACQKAQEYRFFPVTGFALVGKDWGDESQVFIDSIDVLVRIGGGRQALNEVGMMKAQGKPVLEYELESLEK